MAETRPASTNSLSTDVAGKMPKGPTSKIVNQTGIPPMGAAKAARKTGEIARGTAYLRDQQFGGNKDGNNA